MTSTIVPHLVDRLRRLAAVVAAMTALAATPLTAQPSQHVELSGQDVAVYNLAGRMTVEAGTGSTVAVDVTLGGRDGDRLRLASGPIGSRSTLRVIYPDDRVVYPSDRGSFRTTVRVRDDGTFGGDRNDSGRRVEVSSRGGGLEAYADVRIRVPSGRTVAVYLAAGEIQATNVQGRLRLDTHSAPVKARGIRGALTVDVGSGSVDVADVEGNTDLDTGSGRVSASDIRGDELRIDTGSGSVLADAVSVRDLDVDTGSGGVEVTRATAQSVRVDTGSGSVRLELTNDVRAIDIDTGSGGVTMVVPPTYSAEVDIDTGSGSINLDFPVRLTRWQRNHVTGTIGDGRGRLVIETGSGGVRIEKARGGGGER